MILDYPDSPVALVVLVNPETRVSPARRVNAGRRDYPDLQVRQARTE